MRQQFPNGFVMDVIYLFIYVLSFGGNGFKSRNSPQPQTINHASHSARSNILTGGGCMQAYNINKSINTSNVARYLKRLITISLAIVFLVVLLLPIENVKAQVLNIEYLNSFDTIGSIRDVEIKDSIAFLACGSTGLIVLDIEDPSNPQVIGGYNVYDSAASVFIQDTIAYVLDKSNVHILNIANPANPAFISDFDTHNSAYDIFVNDKTAFVSASGMSGIQIWDINDLEFPVQKSDFSWYDTPNIYVRDSLVYMASWQNGNFGVLNVTDPLNPYVMDTIDLYSFEYNPFIQDTLAYIASYWGGLQIVNIGNSSDLKFVGEYRSSGWTAYGIFVEDSLAFVSGYSSLNVFNVANAVNPVKLVEYPISGNGYDLCLKDDILYMADGDSLVILKVKWGEIGQVQLLSPDNGDILDNGCNNEPDEQDPMVWDFKWSSVEGAVKYHLYVKHYGTEFPICNDSSLIDTSVHWEGTSGYISNNNRLDWRWKVRAYDGSEWTEWSEERYFDVEPLNTDCTQTTDYANGWPRVGYDLEWTYYYPHASESLIEDNAFDELWDINCTAGTTLTGDVNGDEVVEVVYSSNDSLYVLGNDGVELWSLSLPEGGVINMLDDVDNDGIPEIILSTKVGTTLKLLFYDGLGNFIKEIAESSGVSADNYITARAVVDLDNDGDMEVVASRIAGYNKLSRGVEVFDYNTGVGTWFYSIGPFVNTLCIADVTGDASKEIIIGTRGPWNNYTANGFSDSRCYVICWDKDGNLLWWRQFEGSGFVDSEVGISDIDGNGSNEIIATSRAHGYNAWDGNLGRVYLLNPNDGSVQAEYNVGKPVIINGIADIVGDSDKEILLNYQNSTTGQGKILMFDASLNLINEYVAPGSRLRVCAINDLNGDGDQELIISKVEAKNLSVLNKDLDVLWYLDFAAGLGGCIITDMDGNGINDLVVSTGDRLLVMATGTGPEIACPPNQPLEEGICSLGDDVCVGLSISNEELVTISDETFLPVPYASWSNDTLCFTADTIGTYSFNIVAINNYGSDTCELTINVAQDVPLEVDKNNLIFTSTTTSIMPPASQTVGITSPCDPGSSDWELTVLDDGNWLEVDKTSGTNPDEVTVSVAANALPLAKGVYSGLLKFTDEQAQNSPVYVNVTLFVEAGVDVGDYYTEAGKSFKVPINLHNTRALGGFTIPLKSNTTQPGLVRIDSVSIDPELVDTVIWSDTTTFMVYRPIDPPPIPDSLELGVHTLGYVHVTVDETAVDEIFTLDTTEISIDGEVYKYELLDTQGDPVETVFEEGTIVIGTPVIHKLIIGTVECEESHVVGVPITAQGFENIAGVELHIAFDPTVLDVTEDIATWDYSAPTLGVTYDTINIAWANQSSPITVADGDTLLTLWFEGIGAVDDVSPLSWVSHSELVDPSGNVIPFMFEDGQVTIIPASFDISGTVHYYDLVSPLPDIPVEFHGDVACCDTADNAGKYGFEDLTTGTCTIEPAYNEDTGEPTIADVVLTQRYLADLEQFSPYQTIAADVNCDGIINITDVIKELREIAQLEPLACGNWAFVTSAFTIDENNWFGAPGSIDTSYSGQPLIDIDFIGIAKGDVNCSYPDDFKSLTKGSQMASVDLQSNEQADSEMLIVKTTLACPGPVAGIEMHFDYDADVLQFAGYKSDAISGMLCNSDKQEIHTAWADINRVVDGADNIAVIEMSFKVLKSSFDSLPLNIDRAEIVDPEGRLYAVSIDGIGHAGSDGDNIPTSFCLRQNYPNPFNPTTTIEFALPTMTEYTLSVYNIAGQLVRRFNGNRQVGTVTVVWDGTSDAGQPVASGVYFYRVDAGSHQATRKMLLLK